MSATRRTAARGSTRVHRNVARGALVGVGLLVATGSGTPAAVAATDTPPDVGPPPAEGQETVVAPGRTLNLAPVRAESPTGDVSGDFGDGKPPPPIVTSTVTVAVTPDGPVPPDLDRSGGTFSLTDLDGGGAATCSTDAAGLCSIATTSGEPVSAGSQLQLSPGLYEVTQTAASAGLLASDRPWYLLLCGTECDGSDTTQSVPNTSLFRRHLSAHVVSAGGPDGTGAGAAVAGASYRLAGPDYPRTPAVPGDDGRADGGTSTSGPDGLLTFGGWFLPNAWTVRSVSAPAGYVGGAPATIVVPSTAPDASSTAWGDDLVLTPGDPGSGTEGSGATGSPAPRPDGAGTGTDSGAGTPQAGGQPAAPASQAGRPEFLPPSEPTPAVPAPAPPVGSPATQPPPEIASAPDVVSPRLTPTSSSLVEVGVIGFGILFVALAVIGVGILRRRVRDRG